MIKAKRLFRYQARRAVSTAATLTILKLAIKENLYDSTKEDYCRP